MDESWSMAAVIAAILIFGIPYIVVWGKTGIGALRLRSRRYIRLQWRDIPEGRVHECLNAAAWHHYRVCSHNEPHEISQECWKTKSSLASCFNRAWRLSERKPQYTKVIPDELPSASEFICTDALTILAFVAVTVDQKKSSSWHQDSRCLSFDDTKVDLETIGGNSVAHIRGPFLNERKMITKHELKCLLSGWPPWYRETIVTRAKVSIPFPIANDRDVSRAGWILAVGLRDENLETQKALALYTCLEEPEKPAFRQNGRMFREAVRRCRDHIQGRILPHFPNNQDVLDAVTALDWLVTQLTGSGMPEGGLGLGPNARRPVPHLRYSDCQFVFDTFNRYEPLEPLERDRLEPIIHPTLHAAVGGAYEVVQYLKDHGKELKIPSGLQPMDREVWLRDCTTRLPIRQ